jgi:lysyl-tRNA synthetase class 2
VYRRVAGLDAWEVGDEAVLDVESFSLQGRAMRGVRQMGSRATRAGVTCTVRRVTDLSAGEAGDLRRWAQTWREGPVERGFSMSMGRVADPRDPDAVVVTACADGSPVGLLTLVPWGRDGLSLDVMRRAPAAPAGVVEAMVTTLASAAPGLGVRRVSLNFAVFRSVLERGERIGAGPVLRLWYRLLLAASRYWQIESLYRANAKYHPAWVPRFLCYRDAHDLPRIVLAALRAEALLPGARAALQGRLRRLSGRRGSAPRAGGRGGWHPAAAGVHRQPGRRGRTPSW